MTRVSSFKPKENKSSIIFNHRAGIKSDKKELKTHETDLGYHYELKIPGYVKEDFRFFISRNDLVITTEKEKKTIETDGTKRSYCYPSALFKMNIPLPKKAIKKEIHVDYIDEVLSFDLLKAD